MPRASAKLLIPLAALLALHPLPVHGNSCGHDFGFHLGSWMDAAHQIRHGIYPHWAATPAWNAGEPRFLFYPPLSWLLGAALTMHLPIEAAPVLYLWLCLTAAGLSLYRLAREFVAPHAALLAAVFYLVNPYMLFNAFERSAMAELLAAAWMPLLLLGILRPRPTVRGIALPLALLWLTNAPAAVMGSYLFALLAMLRLALSLRSRHSDPEFAEGEGPAATGRHPATRLAATCLTGALLGLALPAFYLVPAAYERRYVQVAMAVIPNLRFQDNFLFAHTSDPAHNAVNHTASLLALTLLGLTVAAISVLLLRSNSIIATEPRASGARQGASGVIPVSSSVLPAIFAFVTLVIAFLLVPLSSPIWNHLPELAFLQFPWRLLTVLAPVLALALALLLQQMSLLPSLPSSLYPLLSVLLPLALSGLAYPLFAQSCDPAIQPRALATLLATHHGVPPTDEYTPTSADNDLLRTADPGYWLVPATADPNTPAPHSIPNPQQFNPDADIDIPPDQTISSPAPRHISLILPHPEILILNLRDYPAWRITRAIPGYPERGVTVPPHLQRDDGLLAVALPAGASDIDIAWQLTPDQVLGLAISGCALFALALSFWSRGTF
jgi:hypothetical protein